MLFGICKILGTSFIEKFDVTKSIFNRHCVFMASLTRSNWTKLYKDLRRASLQVRKRIFATAKKKMGAWSSIAAVDDGDNLADLPKVELHLHLDGSVRFTTLLELAQRKKINLNGARTVDELKKVICTHSPTTLEKVLAAFDIFLPCIVGDAEAIERVAYELCEDQAGQNVVYFEARYSPHLLSNQIPHSAIRDDSSLFAGEKGLSPAEVVEAVNRGVDRGQRDFGVKARTILCAIETYEKYADALLALAIQFKDNGVVGIDVAGCSGGAGEHYGERVVRLFQEAEKHGISRTAHAGESNGAESVKQAIEEMKVMRVGHGYHIVDNAALYEKYARPSSPDAKVHFEACPYSSVMTSAVKPGWKDHPLLKWMNDGVNCSISRDDPTCFDNFMAGELKLAMEEIGLSLKQIKQSLNAARAAFLPAIEKAELVERLEKAYANIS